MVNYQQTVRVHCAQWHVAVTNSAARRVDMVEESSDAVWLWRVACVCVSSAATSNVY